MIFNLDKTIEILTRTPLVLDALLSGLNEEWIYSNEGENTWSPFDVVGHLIHGEKTDWILRLQIILSANPDKEFEPFNRFAQFEESKGKTLRELLDVFKVLRNYNIENLKAQNLTSDCLIKKGVHPAFGEVTLAQLLAAWPVHDLGHIAQIARVMAKQYTHEIGPWKEYLPILKK